MTNPHAHVQTHKPKPTRAQTLDRVSYAFPLTFGALTFLALLAFQIAMATGFWASEGWSIRTYGIAFAAVCGAFWSIWVFSHLFCYWRDVHGLRTDVPVGHHLVFGAAVFSGLLVLAFSAALVRWFLFFERDELSTIEQMVNHLPATVSLFGLSTALAAFSPLTGFLGLACVYGGYYSIRNHGKIHERNSAATTKKA